MPKSRTFSELGHQWVTMARQIEGADPGDIRNQVEAQALRLAAEMLEDHLARVYLVEIDRARRVLLDDLRAALGREGAKSWSPSDEWFRCIEDVKSLVTR